MTMNPVGNFISSHVNGFVANWLLTTALERKKKKKIKIITKKDHALIHRVAFPITTHSHVIWRKKKPLGRWLLGFMSFVLLLLVYWWGFISNRCHRNYTGRPSGGRNVDPISQRVLTYDKDSEAAITGENWEEWRHDMCNCVCLYGGPWM